MLTSILKLFQALKGLGTLLTLIGEFLNKVSDAGVSANLAERIRRQPGFYTSQLQESVNPKGATDEEPESDSENDVGQGDLFETTKSKRPVSDH